MVKRNREYKFAAEVADGVENDVLTVAVTTHWDPVETAATRPLKMGDKGQHRGVPRQKAREVSIP